MAAPVQIVWSFDTTGSMSSCLESVKAQIKDLSQRLLTDVPTLEIGLIAHGDYCDRHSSYLIKTMMFSKDPEEIKKWVSGVGSTGGGDAPEAYEIALRAAVQDFAWKKDARKVVALIGDEIPHDSSFPENTDNVDWNTELAHLAERGIRCFGIQCLNNSHATYFYRALADRTDGLWLPMKDLRIMKDVFLAVCLQVADTKAFDQFRSQLAAGGPVASALVPLMTRLAKKKKMSTEELAALCGIVGKLAREHGQPPKEVFLPIQGVEVSARVEGGACEVELVQTFTNRKELTAEDTSFDYRFALPPAAAVFFFEAHLSSGRIIKGVIKAREEARKEYQRAISRGDKAFLMEEKNADVISIELGNLDADETVKVVLKYVTELEEIDKKSLRLRIPQHVAPRSGGQAVNGMLACYPITVNITTSSTSDICALKSVTHSNRLELTGDAPDACVSGCLKLQPEDGLLNNDLVFEMDLMNLTGNVSIESERCEKSGSTMVQVVVRPPLPEKPLQRMKLVLVLDGSCSMQGTAFCQAREAATQILLNISTACPVASCSCFLMQHKIDKICDNKSASEAKVAIEHLQTECGGGTNFDAALDTVQSMACKADAILIISDGQGPEGLQKLFVKASGMAEAVPTRIFSFGVGPDPGLDLLQGLADVTGGVCEVASSQLDIQCAAQRVAAALTTFPVEVQVELPNARESEQWPAKVLAYPGRRTAAYLFIPKMVDPVQTGPETSEDVLHESMSKTSCTHDPTLGKIKINGETVSVPAQHILKSQHLHRLGARKRIVELERLNIDGSKDKAIGKLAMEYGLISSQTSFLAIDDQVSEANSTKLDNSGIEQLTGAISHDLLHLCEDAATEACALSCSSDDSLDRSFDSRLERCASGGITLEVSSMEMRGESLDHLMKHSACLSLNAASFSRGAKTKPWGSRAASAASELASGAASRFAALRSKVGGSIAKQLRSSAPPLLGPTSEAPTKAATLRGCDQFYEGVIQHSVFGPKELNLKLMLDKLGGDGQFAGRWTAMGQAERVVLTYDAGTGVTIVDEESRRTILKGELCLDTGSISGEVIQNGIEGGRFYLQPKSAQIEVFDTDGDHLVFARLLGGGVAEYCNGNLVVASLKAMHIQRCTGICNDGEGIFSVRVADRSALLLALENFLTQEGISVTVT